MWRQCNWLATRRPDSSALFEVVLVRFGSLSRDNGVFFISLACRSEAVKQRRLQLLFAALTPAE
jgi:hypothetical protein